jgi:hypothetical protein
MRSLDEILISLGTTVFGFWFILEFVSFDPIVNPSTLTSQPSGNCDPLSFIPSRPPAIIATANNKPLAPGKYGVATLGPPIGIPTTSNGKVISKRYFTATSLSPNLTLFITNIGKSHPNGCEIPHLSDLFRYVLHPHDDSVSKG